MLRRSLIALWLAAAGGFVACGESLSPASADPTDADASTDGDASTNDASTPGDGGAQGDAGVERVASLGAPAKRVAVYEEFVYVVRGLGTEARLVRAKAPFPATAEEIEPAVQVFGNVVTHSTGAYWGTLFGVHTLAHEAPVTAATTFDSEEKVSGLAFLPQTSNLWFTHYDLAGSGGKVAACTVPGCTSKGGVVLDYPSDIAFAAGGVRVDLAWSSPFVGAPSVFLSGQPVTDAGALNVPGWFASDGEVVYVAAEQGLFRATPVNTGGVVEKILGPTAERINGVAADGPGRIVYAQKNALMTCAINAVTCTPKTIVTVDDDTILDVAVANGFYYWGTQSGLVQRLPRQ